MFSQICEEFFVLYGGKSLRKNNLLECAMRQFLYRAEIITIAIVCVDNRNARWRRRNSFIYWARHTQIGWVEKTFAWVLGSSFHKFRETSSSPYLDINSCSWKPAREIQKMAVHTLVQTIHEWRTVHCPFMFLQRPSNSWAFCHNKVTQLGKENLELHSRRYQLRATENPWQKFNSSLRFVVTKASTKQASND